MADITSKVSPGPHFSRRTAMYASLAVGAATLLPFGSSAVAQESATPLAEDEDTLAIIDLIEAYGDAVKAADPVAVVALFTADGVFYPYNAPTAAGQDQLLATYEGLFSALALDLVFTIHEVVVDGDLAFATSSSSGEATVLAEDVTVPEVNRELFTFSRTGGQWLIARYMYNKTEAVPV